MNTALCILSNPLFYFELFHKEYFGTVLILKGTYFLLKSCVCVCVRYVHTCACASMVQRHLSLLSWRSRQLRVVQC